MNNNSNNCGDCDTTCSECGRPWAICKQDGGCGCNKCKDIKFCEYGRMANGCIREKQPGCPMQAVIPSVTVESIEGIKNLADCLVHVSDINTTFYIDDKHRPIITWAGPIDIPGYDMEGNPNNYRDQIVTDVANQIAVIYDKSGKGYLFGLAENIDLQEQVDNKLDEMAENGDLQEIVESYLDSTAVWGFDTVADMKAASNLVDGSFARTLGYYAVNDGGGGLYKIDNSADVADNGSVIDLDNGLKAKLQKDSAGFINVKQFGAKGDDSTDDTQAFINALSFCPKMNIPTATYHVIIVNFPANAIINGNNSIINSERPDGDQRLNAFGNNSTINDLTVNSLNEDKAWNRIDISGKHDITFNNCKFSGFRDQSDWKNAWAFFIKDTQRVVFNKCYFENNNFQDILIEINSRDIVFNDCDGDHFFVDIEPGQNSTDLVECVTFNRCNMFKVHLYENFLTTTQIRNVTFNDCKIGTVTYDGTTASFNNCIIGDWENSKVGDNNLLYAGMAEFNQSLNLGEDLIQDNYFDNVTLSSSRSWWYVSYSNGINFRTGLTSVREDDTNYIVLNPNNTAGTIWVSTPHIEASAGDKYLLRFSGKANYPANGTWISEIATIRFYDSNDAQIESNAMSAFRSSADSTTPRITQNAIILCPANTAYFVIHFRNGRGGSVNKLYLEKCQLFKLNARDEYSNEIPELPKRKYRTFYNNIIPTDSNNYMPYHVGDRLFYDDPATAGYIGAVCTEEATEGHYVGTWKKYGTLES